MTGRPSLFGLRCTLAIACSDAIQWPIVEGAAKGNLPELVGKVGRWARLAQHLPRQSHACGRASNVDDTRHLPAARIAWEKATGKRQQAKGKRVVRGATATRITAGAHTEFCLFTLRTLSSPLTRQPGASSLDKVWTSRPALRACLLSLGGSQFVRVTSTREPEYGLPRESPMSTVTSVCVWRGAAVSGEDHTTWLIDHVLQQYPST